MNALHEHIGLDSAVAGMILMDNLHDAEGTMLLPQGTALTEAALICLRRRKIESLHVLTDAYSAADTEAAQECQRQRLTRLFRAAGNAGANGLLLRHIMQYRFGENHA